MKEIFKRAKEMILKPKETWMVIKGETVTVQELFINYAAPLALIPAVSTLFGLSIIGIRMSAGQVIRAPFMESLAGGVIGYAFQLLGLLLGAWVIQVLAPYFNSRSDFVAAVKLVVYSMTPIWLLGIFSAFPGLSILQIFGVYSAYLIYLGLPAIIDTPREKVLWYTVLIVIADILISLILTIIVGGAVYGPMFLRMMAT